MRNLTAKETTCVRMLEAWEALADNRKSIATLTMGDIALDYCQTYAIAQPLRVKRDRVTGSSEVTFDLPEFHKYIKFLCDHCKAVENVDGTLTLHDGIIVPLKFKQPPLQLTKESSRK